MAQAALSSLRFNEIDMELVDLEPLTFDVRLDVNFFTDLLAQQL